MDRFRSPPSGARSARPDDDEGTTMLELLLSPYRGSIAFAVATTRASWGTSARVRGVGRG